MSIVSGLIPFALLLLAAGVVAHQRWRLSVWVLICAGLLAGCWWLGVSRVAIIIAAALLALISFPILLPSIRLPLLSAPLFKIFRKILPPLSKTERIALETLRVSCSVVTRTGGYY